MEVSTKPGIYCFTNTINNKCYVGQAINLKHRSVSELSNLLGINEPSVRKQIKRPAVYKNIYKFKTVYL